MIAISMIFVIVAIAVGALAAIAPGSNRSGLENNPELWLLFITLLLFAGLAAYFR